MLREIAVKTLTGRGKLSYYYEDELFIDKDVSKTLGCWIINLKYEIITLNNETYIQGSYSIQLWYALDNDQTSSVYEKEIKFKEKVMMVYRNVQTLNDEKNYKVYVNKYPNAVYMKLKDAHSIEIKIEALYYVDVFQEAILIIDTKDNAKADMTLDEELLFNVNTNYLTNKDKK